jgi:hypothetical protein
VSEFEIYRSKHNPAHFVAVLSDDHSDNAARVRVSQNLTFMTTIADDGGQHLGFDPGAAKAAIADRGFHAFALTVETRDHFE